MSSPSSNRGAALSEALAALGLNPDAGRLRRLVTHLDEVALWNPRTHLVSDASEAELLHRHLCDSLTALPFILAAPHAAIVDVGSGAGFPGIPLAVMIPDAHVSLVERSSKRAGFLRNVVTLIGLRDRVEVAETDMEQVRTRFDVVTFRAFQRIDQAFDALARLTAPGGLIVAYKGRRAVVDDELQAIRGSIDEVRVEPVAGTDSGVERNIVLIRPIDRSTANGS